MTTTELRELIERANGRGIVEPHRFIRELADALEKALAKLDRAYPVLAARVGGGIAGQAFTDYTCIRCDQEKMHPNTACPMVCPECYEELKQAWRSARGEKA